VGRNHIARPVPATGHAKNAFASDAFASPHLPRDLLQNVHSLHFDGRITLEGGTPQKELTMNRPLLDPQVLFFVAAAIAAVGVAGTSAPAADGSAQGGGRRLYLANCAACHGAKGHGDGRAAADFSTRPSDLTDSSVADLSDAALLKRMSHAPKPMPSYDTLLDEAERRAIVQYLRTLSTDHDSRGAR
jgi:mono/diheme cytochrome c family protein